MIEAISQTFEDICRERHHDFWSGARWGVVLGNLIGWPVVGMLLLIHDAMQ